MVPANEGSGMIDVKALMEAARAHAARPAVAPVQGVAAALPMPAPARAKGSRLLMTIAIAALLLAIGTTAFALSIPRERIRGRVTSKPLAEKASLVVTPPAPEAETPVVGPVREEPTQVAPAPSRPRTPRRPRVTQPETENPTTRDPRPEPRQPTGPRTLDDLMNDALR